MMIIRKIKKSITIIILWQSIYCSAQAVQETNSDSVVPAVPVTKTPDTLSVTREGADSCAKCHDEDSTLPVYSIYKTKHAQPADGRTPFAGLQCEACHGPGSEHAQWILPGEKRSLVNSFGSKSNLSSAQQDQVCLNCHEGQQRIAWHSSAHETNQVTCTSCHKIHVARDPVLSGHSQADACFQCHKKVRSDFLKPSAHPVRFGKMTCSNCHQVHGSGSDAMLLEPTLNQSCTGCHAEKRGPLLWEHAPVTEDCRICHSAHGSVHRPLLKKRAPLLCQQCHSQFGHPSVPRSVGGLPSGNASAYLLSNSCINCHSQVHGSNHPSGVKLMR